MMKHKRSQPGIVNDALNAVEMEQVIEDKDDKLLDIEEAFRKQREKLRKVK